LIPDAEIAQSVDVSVGKGMEQHAIYHAKHCNSCASTERQRKNGSECERRRFDQLPYSVTQILKQRLHL
jgi:hypothetical protein